MSNKIEMVSVPRALLEATLAIPTNNAEFQAEVKAVEQLRAFLAATETMRDRVAMQFLPGLMEQYGLENAGECVRRSFQWADAFLAGRVEEPAAPADRGAA